MEDLVLISNPGSASRKYALFAGGKKVIGVHYEYELGEIVYGCDLNGTKIPTRPSGLSHITFAASHLSSVLEAHNFNVPRAQAIKIGVRLVAPSTYFQEDRILDEPAIANLEKLGQLAPLHINAALQELHILHKTFPQAKLIGISDSAFHAGQPDWAAQYGLPQVASDKLDIKRFGYHGLSLESVTNQLKDKGKLPSRLIVAHLGSGSSITAIKDGGSIDCSMGYSPLEGMVMATRSGSMDVAAAEVLADELKLSDLKLQDYLNNHSGLLGISGSSDDIRELLKIESKDPRAALALKMYVYRAQTHIGQMAAALGGVDALVFTGTVGERSHLIRQRIVRGLLFLGLTISPAKNHRHVEPAKIVKISPSSNPAKIYIVPANEDLVMATHCSQIKS